MQGQMILKIGNIQFCVFVQEKYELMGLQQPGQVEYASWDADRDGVVTLAEWAMALGLRI